MAAPLSADQFLAALRSEGVRVKEYAGWRTYNRNHKGPWGPVHGVMLHHTAGTNSLRTCIEGQSAEVPGPLCIGLIDKSGLVHLIGYGRTNHAGKGSSAVLAAAKADAAPPARPGPDELDGNPHFYGFEIENRGDGTDPYPTAQLDASERVSAAICRAHAWTANSAIGHGEWTRRKVDPSFSMAGMRDRIARRLRGTTTPPTSEEDDMPTPADVWAHRLPIPDGREVSAGDVLAWTDHRHNVMFKELGSVRAELAAVKAELSVLTQAVTALANKES
ncbi:MULTISPECIES: N-acetylmuramoyl-L-alanine amidase [Streptomyces]|uniref:peptidoglycan recognition protein family protein n=1 Tax=Streptomyces TaxID=1883 RepID=UPI0007C44184|nr:MULTISPECIES: N-acetylmuramoyl-L-alanine amidase [Streptomyces]